MITIAPTQPTSDNFITITFTGGHACPVPAPVKSGNQLIFNIERYDGPCVSAPLPYSLEWEVGRLRAGNYEVLHVQEGQLIESAALAVAAGDHHFSIPTLGTAGLLLLMTGCAVIGWAALRRGAGPG